jgi:hypothetical protein
MSVRRSNGLMQDPKQQCVASGKDFLSQFIIVVEKAILCYA